MVEGWRGKINLPQNKIQPRLSMTVLRLDAMTDSNAVEGSISVYYFFSTKFIKKWVEFQCVWTSDNVTYHGTLYLSATELVFHSSLFGFVKTDTIPIEKILAVIDLKDEIQIMIDEKEVNYYKFLQFLFDV